MKQDQNNSNQIEAILKQSNQNANRRFIQIDSTKDRDDRLAFAIAVKDFNQKNETNIINEILCFCFDFLPLETINVIKLTNKECRSIMNELLKQSMRAVIIGSCFKELPSLKNKRSFCLKFNNNGINQDTEETITQKVNFIKATTLNTWFIFFEIHKNKFSPVFLEKTLEAFSDPKVCTQLKDVMCVISNINANQEPLSNQINSLLSLSQKTAKNNCIDYTFAFRPDCSTKPYAIIVENQIKKITFPENKNYTLNLDINNSRLFEKIPSAKKIISQPDTQKKINTHLCTDDNVNDLITNIYSKISQKKVTTVDIWGDNLKQKASIVNLTKAFLDEKLYPSLEKLNFYNCDGLRTDQSTFFQPQNNTTIKEIVVNKNFSMHTAFLEFLLNSCKNLKTILIMSHSDINGFSNDFLSKNSTFLLENFSSKGFPHYSEDTSTCFFSLQSLKQMLAHFPCLKTLFLENIVLDYRNNNNEIDQFISFVQNISVSIPNIFFRVSFSATLLEQLTTHIEQFKKDLDKLKETLQAKQCNVSISLSEPLKNMSIKINKKQ